MRIRNQHKKKTGVQEVKKNATAWLLLLPLILLMYLLVWRPTVMGGIWSFYKMQGYTPTEFIGLKNYIDVLTDTEFVTILLNTFKYVFWSLIIGFCHLL